MFTCQHLFNRENINKEIKLIFYDKIKTIKLDESRIIFSNEIMDITCIEMKKNEFDINDYLRIDGDIFKINEIYKKFFLKQIYIISFSEGNQSITNGLLGKKKSFLFS